MHMYVDYLTFSVLYDTHYGGKLRSDYYRLAANPESKVLYRRNVKGYVKDALWIGYSGKRVYVNISGSKSEDLLPDIVGNLRDDIESYASISVSRLDLQQTFMVNFDVKEYIRTLNPSSMYKVMLIMSKQDDNEGIGLYVGSSVSDKRLRVYDKGAHIASKSSVKMEDMYDSGGLLRIELVLRKQVAQKALAAIVSNDRQSLYVSYREECVKRIPELESLMDMPLAPSGVDLTPDKLGRTERWLVEQVLPALARVYISNPTFYADFMRQLSDRLKSVNTGRE